MTKSVEQKRLEAIERTRQWRKNNPEKAVESGKRAYAKQVAKQAVSGLREVRGIFALPSTHQMIKEAVKQGRF